jgi:hypothetical protein
MKINRGGIIVIGLAVIVFLGLILSLLFFAPENIQKKSGNLEVTKKISKESIQNNCQGNEKCFSETAISQEDETICSYTGNEEIQKNCLDNFYLTMAEKQNKIEDCEKVLNEEKKDFCKNYILHFKISNLLTATTVEEIDQIEDLCAQISNQEEKQQCLNNYNYQKAERTMERDRNLEISEEFCDQIKDDEILLDTCHKNLKIRI